MVNRGRVRGEENSREAHFLFPDPPQIVPFSFGSDTVDEGVYAQVSCIAQRGDLPMSITWSLKGDIVSSEPGMTTSQIGPRASILSIHSVGYRHSGTYTCTARNEAGKVSYSSELQVNGNCFQRQRETERGFGTRKG